MLKVGRYYCPTENELKTEEQIRRIGRPFRTAKLLCRDCEANDIITEIIEVASSEYEYRCPLENAIKSEDEVRRRGEKFFCRADRTEIELVERRDPVYYCPTEEVIKSEDEVEHREGKIICRKCEANRLPAEIVVVANH